MTRNMLTVRQVAEKLGVHYKTAGQLVASGEIPATNVSGGTGPGIRWRVDQADLELWIKSRRNAA